MRTARINSVFATKSLGQTKARQRQRDDWNLIV